MVNNKLNRDRSIVQKKNIDIQKIKYMIMVCHKITNTIKKWTERKLMAFVIKCKAIVTPRIQILFINGILGMVNSLLIKAT